MTTQYDHVKSWRTRIKLKLVNALGGKCRVCEYSKCITALEFHHLNANEKEFGIGSYKFQNYNKLINEIKKCILLCSNCHREVHANILDISKLEIIFDETKLEIKKPIIETYCQICKKILKNSKGKFCSIKCCNQRKLIRKIDWNSIDLNTLLKENKTYVAVGKLLNVSSNTIKKQAIKLNLIRWPSTK
jgi:hypothetical protein